MMTTTPQQAANRRQNEARSKQPKLPVIYLTDAESELRDKLVKIYGSQAAAVKAGLIELAKKHSLL